MFAPKGNPAAKGGVGQSLFFADFARQATEFSGRRYPELLHHLRAMRLHGAQTYTQFRGDLLVKHAGDDQVKTARSRVVSKSRRA